MGKIKWMYYDVIWRIKIFARNRISKDVFIARKKYGGNRFVLGEEGNNRIKEMIISEQPFACCRFGIYEFELMVQNDKDEIWGTESIKEKADACELFELYENDNGKGVKKFINLMKKSSEEADIICVWHTIMGDYHISNIKNIKDKTIMSAMAVEPYYYKEPWSEALKGRRVLVISPFDEEIEQQYYKKRENLFEDKRILPQFELKTLKSIWFDTAYKDSRFASWFEAYDYLYEEAMKMDFDIVLLGCGPFGFPLASRFKKAGKQAVHIGGALQILFGIRGKRWENNKAINCFFNDYWIHAKKPQFNLDYKQLDDGCYW